MVLKVYVLMHSELGAVTEMVRINHAEYLPFSYWRLFLIENYPTPRVVSSPFYVCFFFSDKKQMKRLLIGDIFFHETVKCSGTWKLQENAVKFWYCCVSLERRAWLQGELFFLQDVDQSEAVFGVFYHYFPCSFWSALFLPFLISIASFSSLRSRKHDWALIPGI